MNKEKLKETIISVEKWILDRRIDGGYSDLRDQQQHIMCTQDLVKDVSYLLGRIKDILEEILED